MSDMDTMLEIDGQQISLADIAGVNMDDVEEVRSTLFPAGLFTWKCEEAKLDITEYTPKDAAAGEKAKAPVVSFKLKCTDTKSLVKDDIDPMSVVDKTFTETFWLKNPVEDIGRVKAFLIDAGFQGSGSLQQLLENFVGHEFNAVIRHAPNKNDPDNPYANLDRRKVSSVNAA